MWRTALIFVGCFIALPVSWQFGQPALAERAFDETSACHGAGGHTDRDPLGLRSLGAWRRGAGRLGPPITHGMTRREEYEAWYREVHDRRQLDVSHRSLLGQAARSADSRRPRREIAAPNMQRRVGNRITRSPALAPDRPQREPSMCATMRRFALTEIRRGLAVGRSGNTVTVIGDRRFVTLRAHDGRPRHASTVPGDVVVNANWFNAAGSYGPVVSNGRLSGSADTPHRGQILARHPTCRGPESGIALEHVWTGAVFRPDDCITAAVSGVSLVHNGVRADAYPGYDITTGYTNTSPSHSFIGFNDIVIVIVATREMNASRLADYAISLGVVEGVMLDGGGSTQLSTPTDSLISERAVTAFAVLDSAP